MQVLFIMQIVIRNVILISHCRFGDGCSHWLAESSQDTDTAIIT